MRLGLLSARNVFSTILCATAIGILPPAASAQTNAPKVKSAMTMLDPVGSFAPMLAKVIPAVVTILVTGETLIPGELSPRGADGTPGVLAPPRKEPFRSGGSGVIVDPARGHIVTNNHVIANATRIEVSLSDGRRMTAKLVGRDAGTDVAVIEVAERDLPGIPVGDSDKMRVGDVVLAVGNPFGLEGTATLGIVSALMRTEVGHEAFEDFMQIDAAINPGNSGGALVNVRGELIGINTAGPSEAGRATGIGFAIPINMARAIKGELIKHGKMRRGAPGLIVEDLTYELMAALKTRVARGAHIVEVISGSPAASAGIKAGGIVTSVAGKPVRGAAEFNTRFLTVPAGSTLKVDIHSGDTVRQYALVASQIVLKPAERTLPADFGSIAGAVVGDIVLGNPLYGELRGAQVSSVSLGSAAYATGLAPGDVIVDVDGAAVRGADDLFRRANRASMQYRVGIVRSGVPGWIRALR